MNSSHINCDNHHSIVHNNFYFIIYGVKITNICIIVVILLIIKVPYMLILLFSIKLLASILC